MSADAIVANAGTITGSIGVVTGKLVARELKDRLGVGSDSVRTNPTLTRGPSTSPSPTSNTRMSSGGRPVLQHDFVERVAQGRKMTVEAVDAIARGRCGPVRTPLSAASSMSSADYAPRSLAPRCWPGWTPTPTCGL